MSTATGRPDVVVTGGFPTAVELAAVVAALAAVTSDDARVEPRVTNNWRKVDGWAASRHTVRSPLRHGADAWRKSYR